MGRAAMLPQKKRHWQMRAGSMLETEQNCACKEKNLNHPSLEGFQIYKASKL